jgi:hypothetical protein
MTARHAASGFSSGGRPASASSTVSMRDISATSATSSLQEK